MYHLRKMRGWVIDWLDGAAVGASWLCLAHCLFLPLAFALLPALAGMVTVPEWFHALVLAVTLPVSAAALLPRHAGHRRVIPLALAATGFLALGGGLLGGSVPMVETGLTVLGSMLLAAAHVANWRQRRRVAV